MPSSVARHRDRAAVAPVVAGVHGAGDDGPGGALVGAGGAEAGHGSRIDGDVVDLGASGGLERGFEEGV